MSRMTMLKINKKGEMEFQAEFKNSHRCASLLWSFMCQKHLGVEAWWDLSGAGMFAPKEGRPIGELWQLIHNVDVPDYERIALAHTYDDFAVTRKNFKKLIWALRETAKGMSDHGHLPAEADEIEKLVDDDDIMGICWLMTSTTTFMFEVPVRDGEEEREYNFLLDSEHVWLFDRLTLVAPSLQPQQGS